MAACRYGNSLLTCIQLDEHTALTREKSSYTPEEKFHILSSIYNNNLFNIILLLMT